LAATAPVTVELPAGTKPSDREIDVFGLTHPGLVRKDNQDHFLLCTLHKEMHVWGTSLPADADLPLRSERLAFIAMVADGVGGSAGGARASRQAIHTIADYVTHSAMCYYAMDPSDEDRFLAALQESATEAHRAVQALAEPGPRRRAATTLTLGIYVWPRVYILQVGDSRAYVYRGGKLHRITRDQTFAEDMVDRGALSASQAALSPLRSVLSSALGGTTATPVVSKASSSRDAVWLLCTDGLTKHVPDERIAEHLRDIQSSEQTCRALLQEALDGGGSDNVTVLVGRVRPPTA
jgi:protein phosphatase